MNFVEKIAGLRKSYLRGSYSQYLRKTNAELQRRSPILPVNSDEPGPDESGPDEPGENSSSEGSSSDREHGSGGSAGHSESSK